MHSKAWPDCRENPISRFISRQKTNRRHNRLCLICIFWCHDRRLQTRRIYHYPQSFDCKIRSIYVLDQYFRFETTHLFIKQSSFVASGLRRARLSDLGLALTRTLAYGKLLLRDRFRFRWECLLSNIGFGWIC